MERISPQKKEDSNLKNKIKEESKVSLNNISSPSKMSPADNPKKMQPEVAAIIANNNLNEEMIAAKKESSKKTPKDKKKKKKTKKRRRREEKKGDKDEDSEEEDEEGKAERDKKLNKEKQDIIASNFVLLMEMGRGAFGKIYLTYNMNEQEEVATKKEPKKVGKTTAPQLKMEFIVYKTLLHVPQTSQNPSEFQFDYTGATTIPQDEVQGFPKFYGYGENSDSYYLIMQLLGPNLVELFHYCQNKKFTITTVCMLAIQMLNRIEYMHKHHYLHRDIKPENFLIGCGEKSNFLYLIDYGLCKKYKDPKTHQHIPYREGRLLTGTARYVSINTHLGIEQSRRDDLESIGYVLVFFLKGSLPWQGLKGNMDKYNKIMEKKLQIPTEILCYGLPDEIIYYLNYCKSLRFEDRPDYDYLRQLFVKLLYSCINSYSLTKDHLKFDWCFDDPSSIWQIFAKKKYIAGQGKKKEDMEASKDSLIGPNFTDLKKSSQKNLLSGSRFEGNKIKNAYHANMTKIDEINDKTEEGPTPDGIQKSNENNLDVEPSSDKSSEEDDEDDAKSDGTVKKEINFDNLAMTKLSEKELIHMINANNAQGEEIDQYVNKLIMKSKLKNKKEGSNSLSNHSGVNYQKEAQKVATRHKNSLDIIRSHRSQRSARDDVSDKTVEVKNNNKNFVSISQYINDYSESNDSAINFVNESKKLQQMAVNKQANSQQTNNQQTNNQTHQTQNHQSMNNITSSRRNNSVVNSNNTELDFAKEKSKQILRKLTNMEKPGSTSPHVNSRSISPVSPNTSILKEVNTPGSPSKNPNLGVAGLAQQRRASAIILDHSPSNKKKIFNENSLIAQSPVVASSRVHMKGEKPLINKSYKEGKVDVNANSNSNQINLNPQASISVEAAILKSKKTGDNVSTNSLKVQKESSKEFKEGYGENSNNTGSTLLLNPSKGGQNNLGTKISVQVSATNELAPQRSLRGTGLETGLLQKNANPTEGRRRSKIIDINSNPHMMKFSKDAIIKVSSEAIQQHYLILGQLGHGSYGSVKKVKHKQLGEERAMKVVKKRSESSQNEIEILKKISHPNIISIYEIFEDSRNYYIMTELLEGGELFEEITSQGSFSEADAAKIMKQILHAVNYLHNRNIVHRDLKPENILLVNKSSSNTGINNYEIKLIDFGTAKQFEKNQKLSKFIGTSYYIAPELFNESYDEKCDVWSCGVILYILLCGYPPFNGSSNTDIYNAIKNQQPHFSGEEWKFVHKDAIDLIKNMLNKNPFKRYSAEQCLNHRWFKNLDSDEILFKRKSSKPGVNSLAAVTKMKDFVVQNKLKQAVLQYISTQFNMKDDEEDLRELWKEFDTHNKGVISRNDFTIILTKLFGDIEGRSNSDVIFHNLDLDGSGEISYNEFITALIDEKSIITNDRLKKAFLMFDKDGSGTISIDEIRNIFGGDESKWKKIISEVDLNGDGEIDFNEFLIMMKGIGEKDLSM